MDTPRVRSATSRGQPATAAALRLILVTTDARTQSTLESLLTLDDRFLMDVARDLSGGEHRLAPGRYDVALVDEPLSRSPEFEGLLTRAARLGGLPVIILTRAGSMTPGGDASAVEYLVVDDLTPAALKQALRAAAEHHRVRTLAHLAAIVESSTDAIFSRTLDGEVMSWNPGAERMFGYSASEAVGTNVISLVGAESAPLVPTILDEIRAGRGVTQVELECHRKDGTRFPVLLTVSPMRDASGQVFGAASVLHEITERREFQAALSASESEYRATFDEAPVGIAHATLDGRVIRANARILSMFGIEGQAPEQVDFDAVTHPEDRDLDRDAGQKLYAGEIHRHVIEKRFLRHDGTYFWGHVTTSLHRSPEGAPLYFISMVEDVTERRQAQLELSHLFDLSPDMITSVDFEGHFLHVNAAWEHVLGYTVDTLRGTRFIDLVHPDDVAASLQELSSVVSGNRTLGFTNRYRTKSGEYRWLEWHARADPQGRVAYAVARDITERRSLEQQLNQAQKMEAVGRLAGGVAHDFNNLLTAILGFAELTMEQLAADDTKREDIQQIISAAHSAASLTGQLLAFSRKQILTTEHLDLNGVVDGTRALLRRVIGEDVALVTNPHASQCPINADRGQIEQVIMNLAVNARDAMPEGGTLTIETGILEHDAAFVAAHPGSVPGTYVTLTVTDTGTGMEPAVLAQIFEPFFTTKEQGKGTGLGLATVYGIVKQSGGYIGVDSTPGKGTSFVVSLPYAPGEPVAEPAAATATVSGRGSETVLFVEDQQEVRDVIRRTLESRGYHVLEADGGEAALALMARHDGPIHLLLTDVVMPAMSGDELARVVAERSPAVRVLYMSGYTGDAISRGGVLEQGIDFIRKPFVPDQLAARVRETLDRPARA